MKKILRYFPLNQIIRNSEMKSLLKTIGIYIASVIVFSLVKSFTGWIPLVKNLTYNMNELYGYYALAGIVSSCYQYFTGTDACDIDYITLDDIKSLWTNPKIKKGLIIAAVVLCLIPHSSKLKTVEVKEEPVAQMEEQNEREELAKTQEETEVKEAKEAEREQEQTAKEQESEKAQPVEERFVPGEYIGMTEYPGISLNIYDNGAVVTEHVGFATEIYIPSYVEYCGKEYPVKAIGDDVFSWDSALYKLYISETVTTIGDRSIQGCKFLNKLHLGDNLMYIGEASVISNEGVEKLYLPETLCEVGAGSLQYNGTKGMGEKKSYTYSWPAQITEDQLMMRDFYFTFDENMSVHYQYNNYMEVVEIKREDLYKIESGNIPEDWKYTKLVASEYNKEYYTSIYFTTVDVYNKYLANADLVTDYGYYISKLDELSNVNVVLQDGFAVIFDRGKYEPNLKSRREGAENEIQRAFEMSKAFTLTEVEGEKDIFEKICEKCTLGKYQIKNSDSINEVRFQFYRDENDYVINGYELFTIYLKSTNMLSGALVVNNDLFVETSIYGYGAIPDMDCYFTLMGNDSYVVIVDGEQGPDLSQYPKDWQENSTETFEKLYGESFFTDRYYTAFDETMQNMNENVTIDSFNEFFEEN